MIATVFSRNVSQVLIALIACVTTLGSSYLAFKLATANRKIDLAQAKVEEIRIYVNGRMDEIVRKVDAAIGRSDASIDRTETKAP